MISWLTGRAASQVHLRTGRRRPGTDLPAGTGRIALQVLIYPSVDGTNTERGSYQHFGTGYGLSRQAVEDCIALYVPDPAQRHGSDASPLRAPSHAGLAPAFVITAGFDVLRDEGIEYAGRLKKAGVRVRHLHQPHLPHGFITMNRLCREAGATIEEIAAEIRAVAAQLPAA